MPKVFSDPALITAQMGGIRAGSKPVEDEAAHDGDSVVIGVSIAGRTEMCSTKNDTLNKK